MKQQIPATADYVLDWQRIFGQTRVAVQIGWDGIAGAALDGQIFLEFSNDGQMVSVADSITIDSASNLQDAVLWDFQTAAALWRIRYVKNSITAGSITIAWEQED